MSKRNLTAALAAVLLVNLVILSGCSSSSDAVKTENANRSAATSNSNAAVVSTNSAAAAVLPSPSVPAANVNTSTAVVVNKNKTNAAPVKEPTPQIGSGASDLLLFTQARAAVASDKDLLNSVIIDVKEGNAILSGSVPSEAQKTKAAQLVQTVKGIKSVKNNLRVAQ